MRGKNGGVSKLLGIDIGTSGCKAIVIDETGKVLGQAHAEYGVSVPQPGWSEQDPELWWEGVQSCLAQLSEWKVDAIGLGGQMHGSVFLDANDKVIRPAILWNDQRTAAECEEINRTIGAAQVKAITGNPPLTGFQLPKLLWLRNHELSNYLRVKSVLLPKDYIRFRLTGVMATDVSDASGTGIFDVPKRTWSNTMMGQLEIDPAFFPKSYESYEVTGETADGIPVVAGGGDQAAGAVGTGAVVPGVVSVSLGTSGVVFTSLAEPEYDPQGRAHTFCHANGAWHAMSVMLSCAGALAWARTTIFPDLTYAEIGKLAETAPLGANGATFLPYLTGERSPHNDPSARAAFGGLSLSTDRACLARAVFEGVTAGLMDGFEVLQSLGAKSDEVRVSGGGAKGDFWVQTVADMFGAPCVKMEAEEGPSMGAAILAGVGIGLWSSVEEAVRIVKTKDRIERSGAEYSEVRARYANLYASLREWSTESAS